jgi:sugar diacid utilization regulator
VTDDTVTVPVTSGDSFHGALQVRSAATLDEVTLRLLERSAITLALLEAVERQVAEAERRSADEFLEQLAGRRLPTGEAARRQALAVGLDDSQPHVVLVVEPDTDRAERVRQWAAELVTSHGGLVGNVTGLLVVVVGAGLDLDALRRSRSKVGAVGIAGPATGVTDLASAYDDARACLTTLLALGHDDRFACAGDLGPFRYLLSTAGRGDAQRFVELTLGVLLDHDARRGTELVQTARDYLANGQRHSDTARALGIHPNTLYQRLSRIDKVLGPGWLHESRALDIQLALRVQALDSAS